MSFALCPLKTAPLNAVVTPPGSKSITNRALILAALADTATVLDGALDSEDTGVMFKALKQLGLPAEHSPADRRFTVTGSSAGTFPNKTADIYVGNSGTTARFLTAMLAFTGGNYRIYGKERMHQRPIKDLVEALKPLGTNIEYENAEGFPPLHIHPAIPAPQMQRTDGTLTTTVSGSVSSQFLTALLLASPLAARRSDIEIRLTGELVSKPYIEMTLRMMQSFGATYENTAFDGGFDSFTFRRGVPYQSPGIYAVEPDASAASYFFAAAAVCGGSVTVPGLSRNSLQGDVAFADCLAQMNCDVRWNNDSITVSRPVDRPLRGICVDMNSISDTAQTLAVAALFAEGTTEITNIEHVRFKETDRIAALAAELRRFGAIVEERRDGLKITPPSAAPPEWVTVQTYDDHRMAMSFAVAGLKIPGVQIADPECTQKTFPNFFAELAAL
ncbi:MAG: 3-phosphoshikimate 1-carboxyvinyltransferase [Planctomycetaceae bacterium]|jgi:3-phosphoshikimate 1-carboxyvinyltransferase|nr:3-phosphoshikimate 1-carboxyvinyltransferase [Planctomycetaceae bacterium]